MGTSDSVAKCVPMRGAARETWAVEKLVTAPEPSKRCRQRDILAGKLVEAGSRNALPLNGYGMGGRGGGFLLASTTQLGKSGATAA